LDANNELTHPFASHVIDDNCIAPSVPYIYNTTFMNDACTQSFCEGKHGSSGNPTCTSVQCESDNLVECLCGGQTASAGKFCCSGNPSIKIFDTQADCHTQSSVCKGTSSDCPLHTVKGTVFDQNSATKFANVEVRLGSYTTTTNSSGQYKFENLVGFTTVGTVVASHTGYTDKSVTLNFQSAVACEINVDNIVMQPIAGPEACAGIGNCCLAGYVCPDNLVFTGLFSDCDTACCHNPCIAVEDYCSPGLCDLGGNRWCNSSHEWMSFDINDNTEKGIYCSAGKCLNADPDCIAGACQDDGKPKSCPAHCEHTTYDPNCVCDSTNDDGYCPPWCNGISGSTFYDLNCSTIEDKCGDGTYNAADNEDCDGADLGICDINDDVCINCHCVVKGSCGNGITEILNGEQCDDNNNINTDACNNSCELTADPCTPQLTLGVSPASATSMALSWTIPPDCAVDNYKIYSCKQYVHLGETPATECDPRIQHSPNPASSATSLTFPTDKDHRYCFRLVAQFDPSGIVEEKVVCDNTPSASCDSEPPNSNFCINNQVFRCDSDGVLKPGDSCDVCWLGVCLEKGDCDAECNGAFNLFSIENPKIPVAYQGEGVFTTVDCSESPRSTCYLDYTNNIVDKYYSCAKVDSCYRYRSNYTCVNDPCAANLNCQWNSYNNDLGMGVCAPKNKKDQHCEYAEQTSRTAATPDDIYNRISPEVTKEICLLFGDCYFNDVSNLFNNPAPPAGCINVETVACKNYNNEADCGSEFSVVVNYPPVGTSQLTTGSNIKNDSKDKLELGNCKWNSSENFCYTDSNDNGFFDSAETNFGRGHTPQPFISGPSKNGCAVSGQECLTDTDYPITTLINPPLATGKDVEFEFSIVDDNVDHLHSTYYRIRKKSESYTYPNTPMFKTEYTISSEGTNLGKITSEDLTEDLTTDTYILDIFSMDMAWNLEPVQHHEFDVDADIGVNVSWEYSSYLENDIYKIKMNITLESDENITCNPGTQLTFMGRAASSDLAGLRGSKFLVKVPDLTNIVLSSGIYNFHVDCTDEYGNNNISDVEIKIEADKSIYDITPETETFNTKDVEIKFKTNSSAECRYSTKITDGYKDMSAATNKFTASADGKSHSKTVTVAGQKVNKAFAYFIACNMTVTDPVSGTRHEIVEKLLEDVAIFAVDTTPPMTIVSDATKSPETFWDPGRWYIERLKLKFECFDPPINNLMPGMEFGCKEMYFDNTTVCKPKDNPVGTKTHFTHEFTTPGRNKICYYSMDNGSNKETLHLNYTLIDSDSVGLEINFTRVDTGQQVAILDTGNFKAIYTFDIPITDVFRAYYTIQHAGVVITTDIPDITLISDADKTKYHSLVYFSNVLAAKVDAPVEFTIQGFNEHGTLVTAKKTITFNSMPPAKPTLEPFPLTGPGTGSSRTNCPSGRISYPANGNVADYPIYCHAMANYAAGKNRMNTYYFNTPQFFISGNSTNVRQAYITFHLVQSTSDQLKVAAEYNQTFVEPTPIDTAAISGTYSKGASKVNAVQTLVTNKWTANKYLLLPHIRKEYKHFKEYYRINDVTGKEVTIDPVLEEPGDAGIMKLYGKSHPDSWFGATVTQDYNLLGNNAYKFYVKSDVGKTRKSEYDEFSFFIDPIKPQIYEQPNIIDGETITEPGTNFHMYTVEDISGSGVNSGSVSCKLNSAQGASADSNIFVREDGSFYLYKVKCNLNLIEDGDYRLIVDARDYANNPIVANGFFPTASSPFTINFGLYRHAPAKPVFALLDATSYNPSPKGWVINKTPSFTLDYTKKDNGAPEALVVNTPTVQLLGATNTVSCSKSAFNIYTCSVSGNLPEGDYRLKVTAKKTMPSGNLGPEGKHFFYFTVDKTAPTFNLQVPNPWYATGTVDLPVLVKLTSTESDLITEVRLNSESISITNGFTINNDEYAFFIPSSFYWGGDGRKTLQITIMDYAGNANTKNVEIMIDTTPPGITITNISANPGFMTDTRNATVGTFFVNVTGNVSNDAKELCYFEKDVIKHCIQRTDIYYGIHSDNTFNINLTISGASPGETPIDIELNVTDYSTPHLSYEESLFILLDLLPPDEPTKNITE